MKFPSRRHRSPRVSTRKCVRIVGQGVPHNFSNADAHRIVVIDSDGEYCSRSFFKDWRKSYPEHPARCRINSQGRIVADE
jgi:hypothetical protein